MRWERERGEGRSPADEVGSIRPQEEESRGKDQSVTNQWNKMVFQHFKQNPRRRSAA